MGVTFNTTIQLNDTEFRFEKLKVARMVMEHSFLYWWLFSLLAVQYWQLSVFVAPITLETLPAPK